jgi:outer membrane receptor protein involved in Fe transport
MWFLFVFWHYQPPNTLQMKVYAFLMTLFCCGVLSAQTTISGTVTDGNGLPLPGANVRVVGEQAGTVSDTDGNFSLSSQTPPPVNIEVSMLGFATQTVTIAANQKVSVRLVEEETMLNEIVVSASRTPERILESPVTVERMSAAEVKSTTAPTFYDGLENMKEMHFNTSSLGFKSVNTRGFATVANTRFLQLVDGMDNSSPALNFVLGNLVGMSDLDVASVEVLPGASSALYGANAFNGIMFMNSKNPFTNEGISTYFKYGQTSQDAAGTNDYYDFGFRAAKAFTKHFAVKANFTYLRATEWIANETYSVTDGGDTRESNQNYNGLNVYGDEVSTFIPNVGTVSRTGFREQDLTDNKIESVKADFAVHVKPWANDFEIIGSYKLGYGNTIYQGANRYALKNFFMQQAKFEVRNRNFFWRVYITDESAGDSYDMGFAAWNVNRKFKSDRNWFTDYGTAYQLSSALFGLDANTAANYARYFADHNSFQPGFPALPIAPSVDPTDPAAPNGPRFEPGTPQFNAALEQVLADPNQATGAKFTDESRLYHSDINYNFKELIDVAEIQLGGSVRRYELNSNGTIFTDYDGPIIYDEFGIYAQVQKKFLAEERLKFTGSVRYDKSQNFDGFFSPRIAFVYSAGADKKHNFRVSYQTGFRNPTTQDQYIGLNLGALALIGSAEDNLTRYVETLPVSAAGQLLGNPATVTKSGLDAYNNSYTLASVTAFGQTLDPSVLEVADFDLVKPERVQAFEVGYRSVIHNDLSVDINAYYNIYNDFLNQARVATPLYGDVGTPTAITALINGDRRVYQVYTNSKAEVTSVGFGIGVSKKIYKDFEIAANYNFADFDFDQEKDPAFVPGFNTPKHRIKASLGNPKAFKNFGFNLNVRWSDEYLWQSSFADGTVPEATVFDAQVNYSIPAIKSMLKVGGTNLFGKDYIQVIGAGQIGQLWYASITINP